MSMENNISKPMETTSALSGKSIYDNAKVSVKVLNRLILGGVAVIIIMMFLL